VTDLAHPAYGIVRPVTPFASVLLQDNPSPMTLDGTNTWVLRAPGSPESVVVDPGDEDIPHLERVARTGPVAAILITHHHPDHVGGAAWLADRVGAPVRAYEAVLCRDAPPLADGELFSLAGLGLIAWYTPGHSDDSMCFDVTHDGVRAMLTGDSVLGRGTAMISDLGLYLDTLDTLAELPPGITVLPGHGPELPDLATIALEYITHRRERLNQVRAALRLLGEDASPREVVEVVYADVDPALWDTAEWSVGAQLDYLRRSH
jgi:glyoxylase-like metal-dependent hydrolase (beta-lactamase superfamily II)